MCYNIKTNIVNSRCFAVVVEGTALEDESLRGRDGVDVKTGPGTSLLAGAARADEWLVASGWAPGVGVCLDGRAFIEWMCPGKCMDEDDR